MFLEYGDFAVLKSIRFAPSGGMMLLFSSSFTRQISVGMYLDMCDTSIEPLYLYTTFFKSFDQELKYLN